MNKFAKIATIYVATFSILTLVEYLVQQNRRIAGPQLWLITQEMNQLLRELDSIGYFFDQPVYGGKILEAANVFKNNPTRKNLKKYLAALDNYKG